MGKLRSTSSTAYCAPDELMSQIRDALKNENVVAYIAIKIADLVVTKMNKGLDSLEQALSEKYCKSKLLEEKTTHLEAKLDDLEQYSRRNYVRISGITENEKGEDIENIITTVLDGMKVSNKITLKVINRVHRICPRVSLTNKMLTRQIIVQFRDYKTKSAFIKERKHYVRKVRTYTSLKS